MRMFLLVGLGGCLALGAWAQHRAVVVGGSAPYRTFGSRTGFGNVLFPGTGNAPFPVSPFSITDSTFARRLGATVSGFPSYTGAPIEVGRRPRGGAAMPFFLPVFVGGYYGPPQEQQPTVIVYPTPPAQTAPQVTIYQNFAPETARPVIREYGPGSWDKPPQESGVRVYEAPSRPPAAAPPEDQVVFLIALKDGSVYTALAYWVEGETLHYITSQGKHNQVTLVLVDRELSQRLNQGRKVEFRLPPGK